MGALNPFTIGLLIFAAGLLTKTGQYVKALAETTIPLSATGLLIENAPLEDYGDLDPNSRIMIEEVEQ